MHGLTRATVSGTPPRSASAQMKPVDVLPASSTSSGHSGSSGQPSPDSDTEPDGGADNSLDESPRVSAAAVDAATGAMQAALAALPADKPYKYFAVRLDPESMPSAATMVRVVERRETERKRLKRERETERKRHKRERELIYLREVLVSVLHYVGYRCHHNPAAGRPGAVSCQDFAKHMKATPALFGRALQRRALLTLLAGGTYTSTCEATWQLMNNTVHSICIVEASATARRIKTRGLRAGFGIILEPHMPAPATPTAETSLLGLLNNLFCVDNFAHLMADEVARFPGAGHGTYGLGKYLDVLAAKEKDAAYVKKITAWNTEIQSEVNDSWATSMLGTGKIASMRKVKMLEARILDQQKELEDQRQQSSTMEQQLRQSLGEQEQKLDQNNKHTATLQQKLDQNNKHTATLEQKLDQNYKHTATLEQKLDQQRLDSKQELAKLNAIVMQLMAANRTPPSPPLTSPSGGSTTSPVSSDTSPTFSANASDTEA
ncbi:hypothetical protein DFH27DRAFT_616839 [Peziza echinospora]|nr:hypothetical protein DFH27DRAFT_616839 [Peziza echinospora]